MKINTGHKIFTKNIKKSIIDIIVIDSKLRNMSLTIQQISQRSSYGCLH